MSLEIKKEVVTGANRGKEPYFVDSRALHELTELHKRALWCYQAMARSYLSLGIGQMSLDVLQRLQDKNVGEFKTKFFDKIEAELKKTKITNDVILANMREGTDQPWNDFVNSVDVNNSHIERIRAGAPGFRLDLNNYSISDSGEVQFNEADQERLKNERATVYLDSQAKQTFAMLCETVVKDLAKLQTRMDDNGLKILFGRDGVFKILEDRGRQTIVFNKVMINHIQF